MGPDEIRKEIESARGHLQFIGEFGMGHRNVLGSIHFAYKNGTTFNGKSLSERLYTRTEEIDRELYVINEALDRAIPDIDLDDILQAFTDASRRLDPDMPAQTYSPVLVSNAGRLGYISGETIQTYHRKRKALLHDEGDTRNVFLAHGIEVAAIHQDYIDFLESSIK